MTFSRPPTSKYSVKKQIDYRGKEDSGFIEYTPYLFGYLYRYGTPIGYMPIVSEYCNFIYFLTDIFDNKRLK